MSAITERKVIRWFHILASVPIIGYIYGPVSEIPEADVALKWGIMPAVALSGVWLWKDAWVNTCIADDSIAALDPAKYFRANRQILIHRRMIPAYKTDQQGKLTLSVQLDMGEPVVVSKEKAGAFRKWFEAGAAD